MENKETTIEVPFNLVTGTFLRRLNRFMTLVEINDEKTLVHLPNSGRLSTALSSGAKAYLRRQEANPKRKSRFDLFAVQYADTTIMVDAQFSNFLARTAFEKELFDELAGYRVTKENLRVNGSRLDLMLEKNLNKIFIEVKSVTHAVEGVALFPDAPTVRGRKHVQYLTVLAKKGLQAGVLFSVHRSDVETLKANWEIDAKFAELLLEAIREGVRVFTLKSVFQPPNLIKLQANVPAFTP